MAERSLILIVDDEPINVDLLEQNIEDLDYDTISDVILHIRYMAREGGALLGNGAIANLKTRIEEAQAVLGHAKADVTEIYAQKDIELAKRVARETG